MPELSMDLPVTTVGPMNLRELTQIGERSCFSACLLSLTDPKLGYSEYSVEKVLQHYCLATSSGEVGIVNSAELNDAVREVGLVASQVFKPWGLDDRNPSLVIDRLHAVNLALQNGEKVLISYNKIRDDGTNIWHFTIIGGYTKTSNGNVFNIMDPSEVDGNLISGVSTLTDLELIEYITPSGDIPVFAMSFKNIEPQTRRTLANLTNKPQIFEIFPRDGENIPGFKLLNRQNSTIG